MKIPQSSSECWMVLNAIPNIGPINVGRLVKAFNDDPFAIFQASKAELKCVKGIGDKAANCILNWEKYFDLRREVENLNRGEVQFIDFQSNEFPSRLNEIFDAPIGFYRKGNFRLSRSQPTLAIVGSRRTTMYGLKIARQFAQRLAGMGFCIVSGLARGVDTAAHEGALEAGGHTVAVLGNGIDIVYPPENVDLYKQICETGAVISEFCFGRRADRQTFPMRNRIVSGLSDGVLVIESDDNGGSMITARMAGDQGRQVYAIPGRIDQTTSRGCHSLIKDGAILTTCVEDILDDMKYRLENLQYQDVWALEESAINQSGDDWDAASLSCDLVEQLLLETLKKEGDLTVDELTDFVELSVSDINAKLMLLELRKLINKQLDGSYSLRN